MTHREFLKHVKSGEFHPCYFFNGTEEFLIEDCLKRLIEALVDPTTKDFNFDVYYGNEVDAGKIIDTANAYPMLAESRVVVVKELDKLSTADQERLSKYVLNPANSTRLLLISTKGSLGNNALKAIKEHSTYIEFKPLYDNKVPGWIREFVAEKGLEISYEASVLLHARVGNNLRALANELEKIILNLNGNKEIGESEVQKVVGLSRNFSVFNLNDAIGHRDLNKALAILNQMLESGESPTGIVAMVLRHFSNMLKIKGALRLRKPQKEITAMTGLPPFILKKVSSMAQNYSFEQFDAIFECLLETDTILKSSKLSPHVALQTMLVRILNKN